MKASKKKTVKTRKLNVKKNKRTVAIRSTTKI